MQMLTMPEQMITKSDERTFTFGLFDFQSPVKRGSLNFWISLTKAGRPLAPALFKTVVVEGGEFPAPAFYWQDLLPIVPRSRQLWFVAAYGPTVLMTGQIRVP